MSSMACLQKKLIRPWLLRILELSLVENVIAPTSDVHEGSFGLQPMKEEENLHGIHTASMDNIGRDYRGTFRDYS